MRTVEEIKGRAAYFNELAEEFRNAGDLDEAYIQRATRNELIWALGDDA
jgi:hypothetical protein